MFSDIVTAKFCFVSAEKNVCLCEFMYVSLEKKHCQTVSLLLMCKFSSNFYASKYSEMKNDRFSKLCINVILKFLLFSVSA